MQFAEEYGRNWRRKEYYLGITLLFIWLSAFCEIDDEKKAAGYTRVLKVVKSETGITGFAPNVETTDH